MVMGKLKLLARNVKARVKSIRYCGLCSADLTPSSMLLDGSNKIFTGQQ